MRKNIANKKIGKFIKNHILASKKEYLIITFMLLIGISLGVIIINNMTDDVYIQMESYIDEFLETIKTSKTSSIDLFKSACYKNCILAIIIWFFGTTIIGMPVVFGLVIYKGFTLRLHNITNNECIRNREIVDICALCDIFPKYNTDTFNTCYSGKWNEII